MMRRPLLTLALCAGVALAAALPAVAQDDPDSLPEGEGREDAFYTCSGCHSFNLIARQGMSRAMWDDTIRLMNARHGMMELDPEDRARILDYLAGAFPPDAGGGGRRGWTNPFGP